MGTTFAWQNFINLSTIDTGSVRPVIAESWIRCRHNQINPKDLPAGAGLSSDQLDGILMSKNDLLLKARPFVDGLFSTISIREYFLGIADENGYLLDVFGDPVTSSLLKKIDAVPGANWSESVKGTNAIGTGLFIRSPIQLSGAEHYLQALHEWNFSGAPIYDTNGNLDAMLVFAVPVDLANPHTLGMLVATARAIEYRMAFDKQNAEVSTIQWSILENNPHPTITLDNTGIITMLNRSAQALFGISADTVIGKNIDVLLPGEPDRYPGLKKLLNSTRETGRPLKNFEQTIKSSKEGSKRYFINTYPLKNITNDIVGVMAVFRVSDRRVATGCVTDSVKISSPDSVIDLLTGLYNHKYFHEKLEQEVERAKLRKSKISLIIMNIDYFKRYNDMLGYSAGDKLLSEFAMLLKGQIRGKDIIARYGGGEFAVILSEADTKTALEIAERIVNCVASHPFEGRELQPKGKISVSAGVATYPDNAGTKEELLKVVEEALYRAKYGSKSKIAIYFSVFDDLKSELDQSDLGLLNTIKTLITVINAKDKYTFGHSERVVQYATVLGEQLGLCPQELKYIKYGAYLHDIGKIEIGRDILNKKEPLTSDEWEILKCHPQWGTDIVKPITALSPVLPQILFHHEQFDGTGYPNGLKGSEIPLHARILTIADSFDAMTTARPYQIARSLNDAVEELRQCSGTKFDPYLIEVFLNSLKKIQFESEHLVS